jgi:hypothetical protein
MRSVPPRTILGFLAMMATSSSSFCQNAAASRDRDHIDDTVFAVLKLSYNNAGDASVIGGVCGTGFFVGPGTAISAYHVLNETTFTPNPGYRRLPGLARWISCAQRRRRN